MIIESYNIRLEQINRNDIELIREWRNLDHVRRFMEYKQYITREMQEKWFESVSDNNDLYFLIYYQNNKEGVINAKNIDREGKAFEVGLFMGYEKDHISIIPILATLCFFDAFFIDLGFELITTKIHRDNIKAKHFDISLGFCLFEGEEAKEFQRYFLKKETYMEKAIKIRQKARAITGSEQVKICKK
jgi:UDP-4-amino-4,6-dideoxy-N-acetyl-beta-L-altrosamine N-acetyltransferase